tara:strand:- start:11831 stop:12361 length:531 start_codon:yes stop_codon:yes gene_type:complete
MTQAFNLAQFANNLNTAGKLAADTGLVNATPVANGGTGATTLTANNVLLGNGTSAVQLVAPGTAGNVLASNGTTWASIAATGGVTSLAAGSGIVVSGATGAVTVSQSTTYGAVGTYGWFYHTGTNANVAGSGFLNISNYFCGSPVYTNAGMTGTWSFRGGSYSTGGVANALWQRIA